MKENCANIVGFGFSSDGDNEVTPNQLKKINGMKFNGPNKKLGLDDIYVRSIIIMGEEPTTKQSIHPEGVVNRKAIRVLSQIVKMACGVAMLEGHRYDTVPWGRVFDSALIDGGLSRVGKAVKVWYYFLKNDMGDRIADEIDSGIRAEGSISYSFDYPCCSICHRPIGFAIGKSLKRCREHEIGETYNFLDSEQVCYWYPHKINKVLEISHVFAGAYEKTQSGYCDDLVKGIGVLDDLLSENRISVGDELDDGEYSPSSDKMEDLDETQKIEECSDGIEEEVEVESGVSSGSDNEEGDNRGDESESRCEELSGDGKGSSEESVGGSEECCSDLDVSVSGEESFVDVSAVGKILTKLSVCYSCVVYRLYEHGSECPFCAKLFCEYSAVGDDVQAGSNFVYSANALLGTDLFVLKPAKSGLVNNVFFEKDDFKNLPSGDYSVESKFDGVWMLLTVVDGNVTFRTEFGRDFASYFPDIVSDSKNMNKNRYSAPGELVLFVDRKRQTHNEVTSFLSRKNKEVPEGGKFVFKPFDVVMVNGDDIRNMDARDRYKVQDDVFNRSDSIHPVKRRIVSHVESDLSIVAAIDEVRTVEGAMVKDLNHKYNADGSNLNFEWKSQQEVDCCVEEVLSKEYGFVYACSVGTGDDKQIIGRTFLTCVEAKIGDILTVRVDHVTEKDGKFAWFAPRVFSLRGNRINPDPLTVLRKISVKSSSKNFVTLNDVVPLLQNTAFQGEVYLVGGIVDVGYSKHGIDIIADDTEHDRDAIRLALLEYEEYIHFVESDGEYEFRLKIESVESRVKELPFADKYVLQEHWIGDCVHYDFRLGCSELNKFWGFTMFCPISSSSDDRVPSLEKEYGDIKWMTFDDGDIKPGSPGNPSTKNASMKIVDKGSYKLNRRGSDFFDVVLDGQYNKGRFFIKALNVKACGRAGDDDKIRSDNLWLIWKAKNQDVNVDEDVSPCVEYGTWAGVPTYTVRGL